MKIETKRLILREIALSDANKMYKNWASDPLVTKYLTWDYHQNVDVTKRIIKQWLNEKDAIRFGITLKENNELIGSIDVVRKVNDVPEIGYVLSRLHWNNGYMSEALKAFTDYLFSLDYKKIIIGAHTKNVASNKVIIKCGFKLTSQKMTCLHHKRVLLNYYELINE